MQNSSSASLTFITTLVLSMTACRAESVDTPPPHPATQAGSTSSAGSSSVSTGNGGIASVPGGGGSTNTGGGNANVGGATTAGGSSQQKPLPLPFYVNSPGNFVKSGFMGDAATSVVAAPSAADADGTCGGARASAKAGGDCDTFKITPSEGGKGWQGVFYQFPSGNWGNLPGRAIAAGAKKVTFSIRASRAVALQLQVGLCDPAAPTDPASCADGFFAFAEDSDAAHKLSLTTEWSEHSVSLGDVDYSKGVRGAFSWVLVNDDLLGDSTPLSLFIDDITWE